MLKNLRERRDEGFTLIELLIVIIILGILATVVIFAVGGIQDRGQKNACKTEKKNIETALEAYLQDTNQVNYPSTVASLAALKNPTELSARWRLASTAVATDYSPSTVAPKVVGIGKCVGFGDT